MAGPLADRYALTLTHDEALLLLAFAIAGAETINVGMGSLPADSALVRVTAADTVALLARVRQPSTVARTLDARLRVLRTALREQDLREAERAIDAATNVPDSAPAPLPTL